MEARVGETGDREGVAAAIEALFFALWREPAYEGQGAEPGWYRFSAIGRGGRRERLEVRVGGSGADVRACP